MVCLWVNKTQRYENVHDGQGHYRGRGRVEGEGTTNGGLTTEQMAGLEPIAEDEEDSATIESNTLGGTADTGAGPAIGDGQPAE
ncbi:hypothetical protein GCM10027423_12970 [Spirosoma arcticum]